MKLLSRNKQSFLIMAPKSFPITPISSAFTWNKIKHLSIKRFSGIPYSVTTMEQKGRLNKYLVLLSAENKNKIRRFWRNRSCMYFQKHEKYPT
jgi:hypothetical protein